MPIGSQGPAFSINHDIMNISFWQLGSRSL